MRGYFVATRNMPRLPSASPLRAATTRRHRASSRSSGASRSAFASNSTSRPTIPQSAIPCSTYTGTSAGFTKMNLYRRRESSTASRRDINASLETAIPARVNRASDASCNLPLPIAIVNIQGSSFAKHLRSITRNHFGQRIQIDNESYRWFSSAKCGRQLVVAAAATHARACAFDVNLEEQSRVIVQLGHITEINLKALR